MYNPIVRLIIGLLGLVMLWQFYSEGSMVSAYLIIASIALLIWGYFKNGTVYLAFQQMKRENYDNAESLLSKIKNPKLLKKGQKSYYYFIKGFIELNKNNFHESFDYLTQALETGLRTENDTAIVILNLAGIELNRNNYDEAERYIAKTKSLKYKTELESEILRIEKELNSLRNN